MTPFILAMTSSAFGQGSPESGRVLGTAQSVSIPISNRGSASADRRGPTKRLVVKVVGYTPPTDGAVELVITVTCRGTEHELGRIAIYPDQSFTALEVEKAQSFGVPLPDDSPCAELKTADVRLTPTNGTGQGSRVVIESISLE